MAMIFLLFFASSYLLLWRLPYLLLMLLLLLLLLLLTTAAGVSEMTPKCIDGFPAFRDALSEHNSYRRRRRTEEYD